MWKTVVPAAAVLAAEAVIRRKINALPAEAFPCFVMVLPQTRHFGTGIGPSLNQPTPLNDLSMTT